MSLIRSPDARGFPQPHPIARPAGHAGRKVLIVGNVFGRDLAASYYMILPKLLHGLIRLGCNVQVFNDREVARAATPLLRSGPGRGAANRKLVEVCRNFRPDLLLLGHCELIDNATLDEARAEVPGLRIAYRNVDPLPDGPNRERIRRRAPAVDAIFVTSGEAVDGVPPADSAPAYFMPNPVDPAVDVGRAFARSDQPHDLFFAVSQADTRLDFAREAVQRVPSLRADLRGSADRPAVRGSAFMDALGEARMALSLSRPDTVYLYASDRMSQMLGNGLLTFLPRSSGFEDLFGPDEIAFFGGLDELVDKLSFFAGNDAARRKTAEAGWRAAHAMFASHRVAKYILERSFAQPLSESYPWPTAIRVASDVQGKRPGRSSASIAS